MADSSDVNLITLFKELSHRLTDTVEKQTQAKATKQIFQLALDKLHQSSPAEPEHEWDPQLMITDFAYKLIIEDEEETGYKFLEDFSLLNKENYLKVNEICSFLLHIQRFEDRRENLKGFHPFSLSGLDYFFRDGNPYRLLPSRVLNCEENERASSTCEHRGTEDLFLDLFIDNVKKDPVCEGVPSLSNFIETSDSMSETQSILVRTCHQTYQKINVNNPSVPVVSPETEIFKEEKEYETSPISPMNLEFFESMMSEKKNIFERKKRNIGLEASGNLVLGVYEEGCNLKQLIDRSYEVHPLQDITLKDYITNVKYLLCGINSSTFHYDESDKKFTMKKGTFLQGISPSCLLELSQPSLDAGTCCQLVSKWVKEELHYSIGLLQPTFWRCVDNFLVTYRDKVSRIPETDNIMAFKESIRELESSMISLCKLCTSRDGGRLPHGGQLLSHLYEICYSEQQSHMQDIIFSILYECSLVYITKLVEKWIFEGTFESTLSSEFFIKIDPELSQRQDRYCYQSVNVEEKMVPNFLADLAHSIYSAGKAIWLLRMFDPENSLIYIMESLRYPRLRICTTEEDLLELKQTFCDYKLFVDSICGSKETFLSLERKERDLEEERIKNMKATQKLMVGILEKKKNEQLLHQRSKILEKERLLKEQMEAIKEKRDVALKVKREADQLKQMQVENEKKELVEYYREITNEAEQEKNEAEWRGKRLALHQKRVDFWKQDAINQNNMLDKEGNIIVAEDTFTDMHPRSSEIVNDENSNTLAITIADEDIIGVAETSNMETDKENNNCNEEYVGDQLSEEDQKNKLNVPKGNVAITVENDTDLRMSEAMRNRMKVLGSEYHLEINPEDNNNPKKHLTIAERNKMKVLGTEYDFNCPVVSQLPPVPPLTDAMRNKLKVLGTDYYTEPAARNVNMTSDAMKNKEKSMKSVDFSPLEKAIVQNPAHLSEAQKNKLKMFRSEFDVPYEDFVAKTARESLNSTEEAVLADGSADNQIIEPENTIVQCCSKSIQIFKPVHENGSLILSTFIEPSMNSAAFESFGRHVPMFARYAQKSLAVALQTHESLANNAVLKHFILKENILTHITRLRQYFLHNDGEFSRNLTYGLFHSLSHCTDPSQFFDKSLLSGILNEALIKASSTSQILSFQILKMPAHLETGSHDVFAPFQLSYLVKWPVNIIITQQTMDRYRKAFHILLNLKRVHWTLNETFLLLKIQTKDKILDGKRLMNSPEYTKLATFRHAMTLFIMTLEEHISTNGLQEAWSVFTKQLQNVEDLEELYQTHVSFVKDISRRCFLAKATQDLLSYINELIELGLEFHNVLKSSRWRLINDSHYSHPKYEALRKIFMSFCKTTKAFNKTLRKKAQHADMKIHIPMLELIELKIKI